MTGSNFYAEVTSPEGNLEYVAFTETNGLKTEVRGATVPTDAQAGYAKGCVFVKTNGGEGSTYYVNEGSETSCDFNVSAGTTGDITEVVAGNGLTGGGTAGSVTLNVANTDGKITVGANSIDITAGSLVNADINASAAIAFSKLAALTSANILVGNGSNVATAVGVTGDVALSNAGVATVTDLTISGETSGDVLYFNGTNWVRLPATSLPAGTASVIAQSATIEAGANDVSLSTTTQTVGTTTLTVPDFAGVSDTFTFNTLAATLKNKVLDDATVKFGDTADTTKDLFFSLGGATTNKTMTIVSSQTDDRSITLPDATDTLVGKATTDTFTNKTLSDTTTTIGAVGALTKALKFLLSGATADKTMTIASVHTDDRTVTLPDATDTLVGKATSDVLTNKTIDADGTGNVITNINANELDSVAGTTGTYAVPFVIPVVNAGSATVTVFNANAPFKFRVLDVHAVSTKAGNAGNWKLDNGTNDITTAVAYNTSDTLIARAAAIDDAYHAVAANGTLRLISSDAADTAIVYVTAMRVD